MHILPFAESAEGLLEGPEVLAARFRLFEFEDCATGRFACVCLLFFLPASRSLLGWCPCTGRLQFGRNKDVPPYLNCYIVDNKLNGSLYFPYSFKCQGS
jgi:hypothetical protein